MPNVKFSQLPNIGALPSDAVFPIVTGNTNYIVSANAIQNFTNNSSSDIVTSANVQANYFLGNVAFATGIPATYGDSNVLHY